MSSLNSCYFLLLCGIFVPIQVCANDLILGEQVFSNHRLSEFHSVGDVTLFHVVIPQNVVNVQWIITTINDNRACPQVIVTVALQRGSLPLVDPYNTSFPLNANIERLGDVHLNHIDTDTSVALFSSLFVAGDWYVASFIDKNTDTKIKQQGLGDIDCPYLIQLAVQYLQVQNIPSLTTQDKLSVELPLNQNLTIAIYRFYVQKFATKSVTFFYENCMSTLQNGTSAVACPVEFRLAADRIPDELWAPIICNQSDTTCSVQLKEPQVDTWYYVRLSLLYNVTVIVKLDLHVDQVACDKPSTRVYAIADNTMRSSVAFPPANRSPCIYNSSSACEDPVPNYRPSSDRSDSTAVPGGGGGWCPLVLALTPLQLAVANPFRSFVYNEPDSAKGFEVPQDQPVILQFELEPVLDVGGNLMIQGATASQSDTNITLCLSHGALPPLDGTSVLCDPLYSKSFNTTDQDSVFPWSVPFPEAGMWYLSLEASCSPGACNGTVLVQVDISLYACIQGCGPYGTCRLQTDSRITFYYCTCSQGYQGWGCTDDTEAWSQAYFLTQVLLLTLSNIFFIFPCLLAMKRRHFVPAIAFFCTLVFSTFYHACDSGDWCIMDYDTLQFCDFYSAFMSIYLTLITMARLPFPLKNSLEILGAFGMALGTSYNRFSIWAAAVPVGVGLSVMLIAWSKRWWKRRQCYPTSKWRWLLFILPGTAVIITGLCLFAFLETTENYQYVHSAWHVCMALGVLLLLPPRESNTDKQHYNHMAELVDINTLNSELVLNDDPGY